MPLIIVPKKLRFIVVTTAQRYPPINAPAATPELKNVGGSSLLDIKQFKNYRKYPFYSLS